MKQVFTRHKNVQQYHERGCYFFSYFLLADTDVIERGESKAEDERCSNEWRTSLREG
jgi:hypothetical protein